MTIKTFKGEFVSRMGSICLGPNFNPSPAPTPNVFYILRSQLIHPPSLIKWMLHTGGGWGETPPPHMIVKRFGCTTIHNKALYKCLISSFIHSYLWLSSIHVNCLSMHPIILSWGPQHPPPSSSSSSSSSSRAQEIPPCYSGPGYDLPPCLIYEPWVWPLSGAY